MYHILYANWIIFFQGIEKVKTHSIEITQPNNINIQLKSRLRTGYIDSFENVAINRRFKVHLINIKIIINVLVTISHWHIYISYHKTLVTIAFFPCSFFIFLLIFITCFWMAINICFTRWRIQHVEDEYHFIFFV